MKTLCDIHSVCKNFPILETVEKYGIQLKRTGNGRHVARCPFHDEKTGSFFVFERTNKFKCFGCGVSGDPVDFVCKISGCSFRDAVRQLSGGLDVQWRQPDPKREQTKQLVKQFRKWESDYSDILSHFCSSSYRILFTRCNPENWTDFAELIRGVSVSQNHLEGLALGSDQHKYDLYQAVRSGRGGEYV